MSTLADRLGARPPRGGRTRGAAVTGMANLFAVLAAWRRRARSRAELARLSERELRDIGITPTDAAWECAKPFWRR